MVNRTINDLSAAPSVATTTLFLGRRSGQTADEKFSASLVRDFMSGAVNGLVAGDTGAAGANTTALQTALTAGGLVRIGAAGIYWINDTLLIGSNTTFEGVPGVELKMVSTVSKAVLQNLTQGTKTDVNIVVKDIIFNGNKAGKTTEYSAVDFRNVTYFWFERCEFLEGLRTGTFPVVSRRGEGIEMRACQFGYVSNCYAADNEYDGFKVIFSTDIILNNIIGKNNGRSTLQIGYGVEFSGSPATTFSERISANNVTCLHDTGTPSASAPTTSGVYFHGAVRCAVSNVTINGMRQGLGFIENACDNVITNVSARCRWTTKAAIDFEGGSPVSSRNIVSNVSLRPLSGADGQHVHVDGASDFCRVANLWASPGDGTGTAWTVTIDSGAERTQLNDILMSGATVANSGTNTVQSNVVVF